MHIVIPGAWPDPEVATELASHLAQRAPTLARWLGRGKPVISPSLAADTWCTPLEHWLLDAHGFIPAPAEHISAGLGPLRTPTLDDAPVWLAELIHMAPSRDGAALLPANTLAITTEQSDALWASAQGHLEDGLQLEQLDTGTWRVHWPVDPMLPCASPALVALSAVNNWWPQSPVAQPWRRLVNTLQMAWFEHPVNLARQRDDGLAPINSLWLYGGARPSQLTKSPPPDLHIDLRLQTLATTQRWGEWIEALADLDQQLLAPLAAQHLTLVLGGRERYATVTVSGGWLARLRTQDWRRWWCSR